LLLARLKKSPLANVWHGFSLILLEITWRTQHSCCNLKATEVFANDNDIISKEMGMDRKK
jgi:hypothetical protein